jgi:hypothetical protein
MLALNSIEDETPENFLLMSDSKKSNPIFSIIIFYRREFHPTLNQ